MKLRWCWEAALLHRVFVEGRGGCAELMSVCLVWLIVSVKPSCFGVSALLSYFSGGWQSIIHTQRICELRDLLVAKDVPSNLAVHAKFNPVVLIILAPVLNGF